MAGMLEKIVGQCRWVIPHLRYLINNGVDDLHTIQLDTGTMLIEDRK